MNQSRTLIVCRRCDAVYRKPSLPRRHMASCITCGAVIKRAERLTIQEWMAITLTLSILLSLAVSLPIASIGIGNHQHNVSLWALARSPMATAWGALAAGSTAFLITLPLLDLLLLSWMLCFAWRRKRAPGFQRIMRILTLIRPWSALEVVALGIFIARLKLFHFSALELRPGLWCLIILVAVSILASKLEIRWLWEATEPSRTEKNTCASSK